jgi:hypothetical protein
VIGRALHRLDRRRAVIDRMPSFSSICPTTAWLTLLSSATSTRNPVLSAGGWTSAAGGSAGRVMPASAA